MASVTIKGVTKSFGKVTVLQEFNQKFEDGEFITLLGPSGCGKTTMLRLIAGFEKPSSGEIYIGDKLVSSENEFLEDKQYCQTHSYEAILHKIGKPFQYLFFQVVKIHFHLKLIYHLYKFPHY